jgi:hypothetical protein
MRRIGRAGAGNSAINCRREVYPQGCPDSGSRPTPLRDHISRETGAPESVFMAIAGHLNRKMLDKYSHVRLEAKRNAMEPLQKAANWEVMTKTMTQTLRSRVFSPSKLLECLVDLIRIEPMTSSMPFLDDHITY